MAKKKRKRLRKPAPGNRKQVRPDDPPKKPGGLDSPQGPSSPSGPKSIGKAAKKAKESD